MFLVFASIVFVFVKTLVFDSPVNDHALQQSLIAASVGVTVVCLIAWLLDLLQILELREGWGKLLWSVLVVSVLGNSALVYKRFATGVDTVSAVCVRPLVDLQKILDVQKEVPVSIRVNTNYSREENMVFFVSLRNLQKDQNGDYNIDLRYAIEDLVHGNSDFFDYHISGNAEKMKNDPERIKRFVIFQKIAPECVSDSTLEPAQSMKFNLHDFPSGAYTLRVSVYDNVGHNFTVVDLPVRIVD